MQRKASQLRLTVSWHFTVCTALHFKEDMEKPKQVLMVSSGFKMARIACFSKSSSLCCKLPHFVSGRKTTAMKGEGLDFAEGTENSRYNAKFGRRASRANPRSPTAASEKLEMKNPAYGRH